MAADMLIEEVNLLQQPEFIVVGDWPVNREPAVGCWRSQVRLRVEIRRYVSLAPVGHSRSARSQSAIGSGEHPFRARDSTRTCSVGVLVTGLLGSGFLFFGVVTAGGRRSPLGAEAVCTDVLRCVIGRVLRVSMLLFLVKCSRRPVIERQRAHMRPVRFLQDACRDERAEECVGHRCVKAQNSSTGRLHQLQIWQLLLLGANPLRQSCSYVQSVTMADSDHVRE